MKVLVTGASGFVAPHLVRELIENGHEVVLTAHARHDIVIGNKKLSVIPCDLQDAEGLDSIMREYQPDALVHLAAISHVVKAQNERVNLVATNVVGTHNLCAALTKLDKSCAFLYVSSSMVYGNTESDTAFSEESLPQPSTPYGASKLAGEYVVRSYASELFKPYIVRPFNHIGPGQSTDFVCPALAKRIVDAKDGGTIEVGNLKAKRDFSDVRDIVRAYRLILEKQPKRDLFVLGSGKGVAIQSILDSFIRISKKNIETQVNQELLRANDPPVVTADPGLAEKTLGWRCLTPLSDTLADIYHSLDPLKGPQ